MVEFEALVVGGGPAGLISACLLAQSRVRTAIISPAQSGADSRTVALMRPSIDLLSTLGIWSSELQAVSAPLKRLRIVDDFGGTVRAPDLIFVASEIGLDEFGWNVPLSALIVALVHRARAMTIPLILDAVQSIEVSPNALRIVAGSGSYTTRVAIAADGRSSPMRRLSGVDTISREYDQAALTLSFAHSMDHRCTSIEHHYRGGPLTTVPLPGKRSSLVWLDEPHRIEQLKALSDGELAVQIQIATHGSLGLISSLGSRTSFRMRILVARQFASSRVMLVGEAAHVVPPIGAQGLNMSLRDAAHAAELIIDALTAGEDPGSRPVLEEYDQIRRRDVLPRQAIIDLLNRTLLSESEIPGMIRAMALTATASLTPARRLAVSRGAGTSENLPRSMQS
jgi:2-octaprenyl-6-methoxyphenol hydroxylase